MRKFICLSLMAFFLAANASAAVSDQDYTEEDSLVLQMARRLIFLRENQLTTVNQPSPAYLISAHIVKKQKAAKSRKISEKNIPNKTL